MSRSVKTKLLNNIKQLMHSVLFRRLTLSWTIILAALLVAIVIVMIVTINSIYSSNEAEYLSSSADQVTHIRKLLAEGGITEEGASRMLAGMCDSSGFSSYIFLNGENGVSIIDRAVLQSDTSPTDEELIELGEKLFNNGSLSQRRVTLNNSLFVIAGKTIDIDGSPAQAVVCLRSILELQQKQRLLLIYVLVAITLTLIVGFLVIAKHVGSYITPFTEITRAAIDMSYGNLNTRVKHENVRGEIGLLSRSFNRLSASLSQNFIQLEQERSRLVQIVNSSAHGIAVIDAEGELIQYNPALMDLFAQMRHNSKYDISEDRRLMVIPDKSVWSKFDSVNQSGESQKLVYPIDQEHVLWINISPVISAEGEQVGAVGNFQDMTELERLERTRREYVANVSHELRRPLTALQGLLEPIKDGLVTDEENKQRYYDIMLNEIQRLNRLISDMMQLSRLQSDKINLNMEPLDISEIVADVAESYRSDIESRGTTFKVDAPEGMVAQIDVDRIAQIIIILLDNAIKFTPDDGTISISTYKKDGRVCLEVRDTGCGISEEDLPHVFERFYKADRSHGSEGTGLGLSIADSIVKKMQGSITCESKIGEGTSMKVCFEEYSGGEEPGEKEL